jgi:hypothetical protein
MYIHKKQLIKVITKYIVKYIITFDISALGITSAPEESELEPEELESETDDIFIILKEKYIFLF